MNRYRINIQRRHIVTPFESAGVFTGSILAGFAAIGVLFLLKGVNPFQAFYKIFAGSFFSVYGIKETITKAIPLILIASGLTVVFRSKFWNIGAESQLLMGAVFTGWVGLNLGPVLPGPVLVPAMILAGFLGGAIWALPPAYLKVRFGINEVISTLMFNYIAAEIVKYLVVGPWKGETQHGYPYTDDLPAHGILAQLPGSRIHFVTLILAVIAALVLWYLLFRTRFGYEVRVIGENHEAAKYAGIGFTRTTLLMMAVSGGVAGIAGFGELAGIHYHLTYPDAISGGYGFTAIIVAWLAKLNPLFVIFAGLFFAGIVVGGDAIQISFGLPAATVQVFNGVLLIFLIMGDYFLHHRVRIEKTAKNLGDV
ncbi:MAG: ABC transporter permease [Spirochaetales bacterium]|nr:ABC transporter permease [Spirochaetales bacterium]